MLNASFVNIPLLSDQDRMIDLKCPLPVDEALLMAPQANQKKLQQEVFTPKRYFPTSAMYNRQIHFQRMDIETLFFAFYFQQETYQQYLSALELKKRGWEYHTRFQTWLKKETVIEYSRGKQQSRSKIVFFDFENEWKIKVS